MADLGQNETSRRWTIYEMHGLGGVRAEAYLGSPDSSDNEGIEVMPVAEVLALVQRLPKRETQGEKLSASDLAAAIERELSR